MIFATVNEIILTVLNGSEVLKSRMAKVVVAASTSIFLMSNLPLTPAIAIPFAINYSFTGAEVANAWTVPVGICALQVDAQGAGGYGHWGSASPSIGGSVLATLSVSQGEVVSVAVGGAGAPSVGGFGGGGSAQYDYGGGGGATVLKINSVPVLVAGGGGGTGYASIGGNGGNGSELSGQDGQGTYGNATVGTGATETTGGSIGGNFLIGGDATQFTLGGGGGGGYYGGGGGTGAGGGGGSAFVEPSRQIGVVSQGAINKTQNQDGALKLTPLACGYPDALLPGVPTITNVKYEPTKPNEVKVLWSLAITGGAPILRYRVEAYDSSLSSSSSANLSCESVTLGACIVGGLKLGHPYTFRVQAINKVGAGIFSAPSAPFVASTKPGAPINVTGTSGDGEVLVTWDVGDTGGADITSSMVKARNLTDPASSTDGINCVATNNSCRVRGLVNGERYSFSVKQINKNGESVESDSSSPVIPQHAVDGSAILKSPTAKTIRIGQSLAESSLSGGIAALDGTFAFTNSTVVPLNAGVYVASVTFTPTNQAYSAWVFTVSVAVLGPPGFSTDLHVTDLTDTSVSLSWTAPTANGDAITNYIVEFSTDSGVSWTTFSHQASSSTSITVTGLSRGITHLFRVSAVNGQGAGSTSASASATPQVRPVAPVGINVTRPTSTSLTLSWSAPDNGGSTITGYQIRYSSNGGSTWSNPVNTGSISTSYTVSGLSTGTSYVFQIAAINSVGKSDWSNQSSSAKTLSMKTQKITFTAPASVVLGKPDVTLTVKTSAVGLTTKLTVARASAKYCSIVGTKVHAKAVGTCTVVATQVGNAAYLPATPVIRTIAIKKK